MREEAWQEKRPFEGVFHLFEEASGGLTADSVYGPANRHYLAARCMEGDELPRCSRRRRRLLLETCPPAI